MLNILNLHITQRTTKLITSRIVGQMKYFHCNSPNVNYPNKSYHQVEKYQNGLYKYPKINFSKRGSKEWMDRHTTDVYVKKSKSLEYRSRASFKLLEVHQKYKLLRPGQKVLDVGSAPGGWSQVISEYTKSSSKSPNVIAVDILRMDPVDGVIFIQGDMTKTAIKDQILEKNNYEKFDLILSDMCPEFTGTKATDHGNLIRLNQITIDFATRVLKRNGNLIIKTFEGTLQKKLQEGIKKQFNKIHRFKPASSRAESSEMYLICIGYLENEELKKELEEFAKMSPEEYYENQKKEAIRSYKLLKLNKFTLIEDLDKLKEEIKNKFKIDPEKVPSDPKEEEEIAKIIEEENDKLHKELYGRAYRPMKEETISEFVENYQKEMKELDEKLKTVLKEDVTNFEDYEEFFKEDEDAKHMQELAAASIKDIDFLRKKVEDLEKRIGDEDIDEVLRSDNQENEILTKYKRWEGILKDLEEEEKLERKMNPSDEINIDYQKENLQESEDIYMSDVQNLKKKLRKDMKSEMNKKENSDVFWEKKTKTRKDDQ